MYKMNLTIYKIQVDFYILHKSASEMEKSHTVCSQDNVKERCMTSPERVVLCLARCDRLQTVYTRSSEAHTPEELSYKGLFKIGHLDIFHK